MSKYNRNPKSRKGRKWLKNVGDGARLSLQNSNPNDAKRS